VKNSASQQTTNGSHNGAHCQAVPPTTPKSTPFGRDGRVMHGMWSIGMTNVVNLSRIVVWDRVHVLLVTYILPLWQNTVTLYAWAHAHQLWLGVPKDPSLGHYSSLSTIAQSLQVLQQQYTDTQLYVALSPLNYSNEIDTLQSCLSAIHV